MSLSHLLQQFDAMGPQGPRASVTLNQGFVGSSELITMWRVAFGVEFVTIDAFTEATSRGEEHLELRGTTSLLGFTDTQVTFRAEERDGELFVRMELALPSSFSFEDVCPDLPGEMTGEVDSLFGVKRVFPNFLTRLGLGACKLVFSSRACFDAGLGTHLVAGLNFAGELYLLGDLYTLGLVLRERSPLPLVGPINEFVPAYDPLRFTGIRLLAPLPIELPNAGPFSIKKAALLLKSPLDEQHPDPVVSATQGAGVYAIVDGELAGRPLQMIGKWDHWGADDITIQGRFTDFAVSGFSGVSQAVGIDGFGETMPEDFRAPEGLAITELGLTIDCESHELTALSLGLGVQSQWELVPGVMTLREIGVRFAVANPFGQGRAISTTLSGLLSFGRFSLAAYVEFPSLRLGAGLPAGQTLPLGDVLESFLPGETELPPLLVRQLLVRGSLEEKTFSLNLAMEDLAAIQVGATAFEVKGMALVVDYDKARGGARALACAQMRIAEAMLVLAGELNGGLTLSGSLSGLSLKKLWNLVTNGESLPSEVPDVVFESLSVRVTPATGAFSLLGNATVAWEQLSNAGPLQTNVQFSLTRDVSGEAGSRASAFKASLSLQGQGPVRVVEGFSLQTFNLLFDYQTGSGWKLSGGVGVELFGTRLDLQAGYETAKGTRKIKLRAVATPPKKLIGLDGVGAFTFSQFDLLIDRRAVDGGSRTFFDLRVASTLALDNLLTVGGFLSITNAADGKQALLFKPNPGTAAFRVDFPAGEGMGLQGELFELGFARESNASGWSFTGTVTLGFTGFPAFLGKALPSKVTARLVAGWTDVRLSALNVSAPVEVAFPSVRGKRLGKAVVQLLELGVSIKPQAGLVIEAGLGLPAELNKYLGTELFRVYQPGNPATMARTRLTISGAGVAMQFLGSPFAAANTAVVDGESWFDVDFGKYGAISLKMPTFVYDGAAQYFEAGGGIKIKRTLALPLAPLKMFLEACGGKDMADVFPDRIPLEGLSLVDESGDLKLDELIAFLKKAGDVPGEVTTALKQAGKVLNRFPEGFKQYFDLELPEHLEFKLGFSPSGRISLGLLAPEKPVRVLFPAVVQSYVPMPGLWGIEVRKFSVGTLMAGSVLYGEVDARIDQYDLPSLVVSLALPRASGFPLPTSDQLQRRIILDDVFCVIPVSAGSPVPIPLFYDELGFEYLGIEGLGLGAHVSFPKPALGASGAAAVFQALERFISKPNALLDPKTPPGGVELAFSFHDEFLQAPEYLGGGVLGTRGKTYKVGTWKNLASMLNFAKTFSINECIGAIPIENRVGSARYRFAFMSFDADWLLTTPEEFKGGAFERLKLSASDRDDFLAVLPSVAGSGGQQVKAREEGMVAFVRGQADLGFLRLEAALGLAASGSMGFNTGFKFEGTIGKVELQLMGAVMVNAPLAAANTPAPTPTPRVEQPASAAPAAQGGRALFLNGKDAWIEIPASDSLVLPEYTVELWINPAKEQAGEWAQLFGADSLKGGYQRNHYLELNAKQGFYHHRFKDASGGNAGVPDSASGSVAWGQWQHVAITNDGVTARTFIDGKEVSSGAVNGGLVLLREPIFMGNVPGGQSTKLWKGQIAEVRIWKRARRGGDIAERRRELLTGSERDLVSLYRFDRDTGARAIDVCGRNHGTIKNGSFVDSDLLMLSGLELDGKSDSIEIPDSPSLRFGAYTVELWLKPYIPEQLWRQQLTAELNKVMGRYRQYLKTSTASKSSSSWATVFSKKGRNYTVVINRKGFVHHRFHTSKDWNDGISNTPDGVLEWNQWNHVAITNDGKTARTFVNGVKQAEGPVGGNGLIVDNGAITIGRDPHSGGDYFKGELGEIRLWSGARSPEELAANMSRRIDGQSPALVSLWRMSDVKGDTLADLCGRNPGRLAMKRAPAQEPVAQSPAAQAAVPGEQGRAAIQIQGHTHLKVLGRQVLSGDLRLVDSTFWFSGQLDLFPADWPIRVRGHVDGMVSRQRFYLSGETENALFGLVLSSSRIFISNEQMRLEGRWLGLFLLLNISWDKDDPLFAGTIGFRVSPTLDFGAIRIGGVKVADNVRLEIDIGADVSVSISKRGFSANVHATFQINGKGFELSFGIDVAPGNLEDLVTWIGHRIIDAPEKYLAHLFSDAETWLKNVVGGTIEFARHAGAAVGAALKSGFKLSKEAAASLMKNSGYAAHQVGAALGQAYGMVANDAAALLKSAGYAVEDVGNALQVAFRSGAEDAARVLKNIGYTATDVNKALGSAFGKGAEECEKILKGVGFSSKEVSSALKSAGKTVENGLEEAYHSVKFW